MLENNIQTKKPSSFAKVIKLRQFSMETLPEDITSGSIRILLASKTNSGISVSILAQIVYSMVTLIPKPKTNVMVTELTRNTSMELLMMGLGSSLMVLIKKLLIKMFALTANLRLITQIRTSQSLFAKDTFGIDSPYKNTQVTHRYLLN